MNNVNTVDFLHLQGSPLLVWFPCISSDQVLRQGPLLIACMAKKHHTRDYRWFQNDSFFKGIQIKIFPLHLSWVVWFIKKCKMDDLPKQIWTRTGAVDRFLLQWRGFLLSSLSRSHDQVCYQVTHHNKRWQRRISRSPVQRERVPHYCSNSAPRWQPVLYSACRTQQGD